MTTNLRINRINSLNSKIRGHSSYRNDKRRFMEVIEKQVHLSIYQVDQLYRLMQFWQLNEEQVIEKALDTLFAITNKPLADSQTSAKVTLEQAIKLYLADQCTLFQAAELAGGTCGQVMNGLKERGLPNHRGSQMTLAEKNILLEWLKQEPPATRPSKLSRYDAPTEPVAEMDWEVLQ